MWWVYRSEMDTQPVTDKEVWFKRRQFGWGWTPCTWQGWLMLAIYIAIVAALAMTVNHKAATFTDVGLGFLLPITLLTIGFIRFCYAYGEAPRWSWGNES